MKRSKESDQSHIWISTTDLMSALALTFILILVLIIGQWNKTTKTNEQVRSKIEEAFSIRSQITKDLREELGSLKTKSFQINDNGDITFDEAVLFDLNSADMKEPGKTLLDIIMPRYLNVMLRDQYFNSVESVMFEGHSDPTGEYFNNLKLSQSRAFNVSSHVLRTDSPVYKNRLDKKYLIEKLVAANGRSWAFPVTRKTEHQNDVCTNHSNRGCGWIDYGASRRVVVRFYIKPESLEKSLKEFFK
ncbi:MAG: hypothetical protein H7A33_01310 [Deltaproteobacteria bacterium]|nr:hypothetical protein [Deltaproteobacteria bacterium]